MSTINVPLLRKVLEHITAHPDEWDQGHWAQRVTVGCGTTHCIAGHTVVFVGYEIDWGDKRYGTTSHVKPDPNMPSVIDRFLGRETREIELLAQHHLGLAEEQAEVLFYSHNDLPFIWQLAHEFTDGEIAIPAQFQEVSA